MTTPAATKPLPEPDDASRPFWEGAREGRLMLMRCGSCAAMRLPSREHCDRCLSTDYSWVQASGRGTVRSFGVMHQIYHPAFKEDIPYTVAVVELEEGPRIQTNIVETGEKPVEVDMPVVVTWEVHEDVSLPKFRPA